MRNIQARGTRFAELVYEGDLIATRVEHGVRIRAGDVEVSPTADGGFELSLKKSR